MSLNIPCYPDHQVMLAECRIGGAIVATPNSTHADIGIACLDAGVPVLMEKPVAESVEQAQRLCERAEQLGIPLLVGHQRRHNPILQRARELIANGVLGRLVSATAMAVWFKPDSYFEPAWRREAGGGPVLINLVHDIDVLRFLLGDVVSVQATMSNEVRGFEVEDTAAVVLTFANGVIAAMSVSDAAVSPWNWDLAAGESAYFVQQDVNSYYFCGTHGSLALPRLEIWRYDGARLAGPLDPKAHGAASSRPLYGTVTSLPGGDRGNRSSPVFRARWIADARSYPCSADSSRHQEIGNFMSSPGFGRD
ncbi:Gfo/Idh/MocA family oxidoreductase [Polaromonas sp. P1-6]|nr:Gfo/Idh/MocA family oxidoreductase [Polaromonas sp. P1-6]